MFRRCVPSTTTSSLSLLARSKSTAALAPANPVSAKLPWEEPVAVSKKKASSPASFQELTNLHLLHGILSREAAPTWDQFSTEAAKKHPNVSLVGVRSKLENIGATFLAPQQRESLLKKAAEAKKRASNLEAKQKAEEEARANAAKLFKQTLNARVFYADLVKARGGVEPTWREFAAEVEKRHGVKIGTELQRKLQGVPGIVFLTKAKVEARHAQEVAKLEKKQQEEMDQLKADYVKQTSALMGRHNSDRSVIDNRRQKLLDSLQECLHPTDSWWTRNAMKMERDQAREFAKTALHTKVVGAENNQKK